MRCLFKNLTIATAIACAALAPPQQVQAAPWVTAYYASYTIGAPSISALDLRAITHLIFFHLSPTVTGGLVDPNGGINENTTALASTVHAAGKKVIICVGGGGTRKTFTTVLAAPSTRAALVDNIVAWTTANGFDGVDIDDEPLAPSDGPDYESFIRELRAALPKGALITCAAEPYGYVKFFAHVQHSFDQINVMTYDMAGRWTGYAWYNSNLHSAPSTVNDGTPTSCAVAVQQYIDAGIPASKLGIGAAFYGDVWDGATAPMMPVNKPKIKQANYNEIMSTLYSPSAFHRDNAADAPYLSLTSTNQFCTYDDQLLCAHKVDFVVQNKLGGLICFDIGAGYMPDGSQPLLDAIYNELAGDNALPSSSSTTAVATVDDGNIAPLGSGFAWSGNAIPTTDNNRISCPGINDGNLKASTIILSGGETGRRSWEAAGIVWQTQHSIQSVTFVNGISDARGNGFWQSGVGLEFSADGLTWTKSDWTMSPAYEASNAAWGQTYTFTGPALSNVKGVRVVGQTGLTSRTGSVIEMQVDGK